MTVDIIPILAKTLRYRTLDKFIGRKVVISTVEEVQAHIKEALSPLLPAACSLDDFGGICNANWRAVSIAKYGFLDLAFLAPSELLESDYTSGLSLLRELRLIYDAPGEPGYETDGDLTPSCYEQLLQEVLSNRAMIRLFLRSDRPRELVNLGKLKVAENWKYSSIPDGYLPRSFSIEDACIANARSVWMSRHWYM